MMIRTFFLLLLMVALVGLGVFQARADLCPPACGHCQMVPVAQPESHSCCDEQGEAAAVPSSAEAAGLPKVAGCTQGLSCLAAGQHQESISGVSPSKPVALTLALPGGGPALPRLAEPSAAFRPLSPPLTRAPNLFTRNCSFLI